MSGRLEKEGIIFEGPHAYLRWLKSHAVLPAEIRRISLIKRWILGLGWAFAISGPLGAQMGVDGPAYLADLFVLSIPPVLFLMDFLFAMPFQMRADMQSGTLKLLFASSASTWSVISDLALNRIAGNIRSLLTWPLMSLLVIYSLPTGMFVDLSLFPKMIAVYAGLWLLLIGSGAIAAAHPRSLIKSTLLLFFWVIPIVLGVIWGIEHFPGFYYSKFVNLSGTGKHTFENMVQISSPRPWGYPIFIIPAMLVALAQFPIAVRLMEVRRAEVMKEKNYLESEDLR